MCHLYQTFFICHHSNVRLRLPRLIVIAFAYFLCATAFITTTTPSSCTAFAVHPPIDFTSRNRMFNFKTTPGAGRTVSVSGDHELDWTASPDFSPDQKEARMVNAIFSASVVLQDASVSNGILNGTWSAQDLFYSCSLCFWDLEMMRLINAERDHDSRSLFSPPD
jgi:hypothetical protein